MARMPQFADPTEEIAGPAELDESGLSMQVLDDLEEWISQKRAEMELGPLKSKGTTPPPPLGE